MDIRVGIALYSMMITIVVFLGGFLIHGGMRIFIEMCVGEGRRKAVEKLSERKGIRLRREEEFGSVNDGVYMKGAIILTMIAVLAVVVALVEKVSEVGVDGWEDGIRFAWLWFFMGIGSLVMSEWYLLGIGSRVLKENKKYEVLVKGGLG